ncbi:MAG: hypothetical protein GTN99_08390 [Candidatus Dadabacteria bacterium]|nr:hypothetical protein [Candidatus Dadabacteria bacterium]
MRILILIILFLVIANYSTNLFSDDFDGSKSLFCSVKEAIECYPASGCNEVANDVLNLPNFINIDFKKKLITGKLTNGEEHSSKIERIEHVDGKITIAGAEDDLKEQTDGVAWSMSINKTKGNFTVSASGDDVAFIVFGACTTP